MRVDSFHGQPPAGSSPSRTRRRALATSRVAESEHALELLCEAAILTTLVGEFDETIRICEEVLTAPEVDDLTTWTAAINLGYGRIMLGDIRRIDEPLRLSEQLEGVVRHEHPEGADLRSALAIGATILDGRIADAAALTHRTLDELRRTGRHRGVTAAIAVEALVMAGDPNARVVAREAVDQLHAFDPFAARSFGLGYAALAAVLSGDLEDAGRFLAEIDRDAMDVRSLAVVGRADGAFAAAEDRIAGAAICMKAGREAIAASHVSLGAFALFDALCLGGDHEVALELVDIGEHSSAPLLDRLARLSAAIAARSIGQAISEAIGLEESGALWLGAEAHTAVARTAGDDVTARRLLARAAAIRQQLGLPAPPWATVEVDDALSPRQIEVARLAVAGRSNREIADALYISARTVGNHLHHVYKALAVDGREGLGDLLRGPAMI